MEASRGRLNWGLAVGIGLICLVLILWLSQMAFARKAESEAQVRPVGTYETDWDYPEQEGAMVLALDQEGEYVCYQAGGSVVHHQGTYTVAGQVFTLRDDTGTTRIGVWSDQALYLIGDSALEGIFLKKDNIPVYVNEAADAPGLNERITKEKGPQAN